ncbi:MAG TPA: small, acid-soluble spore protein K [Bacillales bacterium]|nr:small, acid-soluble spore protein K [Bacillales bacterium]
MVRNKAKGFPNRISLSDDLENKDEFASQRPDGSIKDHPQERMFRSNQTRSEQEERD